MSIMNYPGVRQTLMYNISTDKLQYPAPYDEAGGLPYSVLQSSVIHKNRPALGRVYDPGHIRHFISHRLLFDFSEAMIIYDEMLCLMD